MTKGAIQDALDTAIKLGAVEAELVCLKSESLEIEVCGGDVESLAEAESIGTGLRLFTPDRRMGFAFCSDVNGGLTALTESAWQNALGNDPDPHNGLHKDAIESFDDWTEEDFAARPVAEKIDIARSIEAATLASEPRVRAVQQASYGDILNDVTIANTHGLFRRYRSGYCSASVVAVAAGDTGDPEMGWEFDFARTFEALRPNWVADRCAQRAVRGLGGKPCASCVMPIVLENYVAMQILGILSTSLAADEVLKGRSMLAHRVGDAIASEGVSIYDQNDLPEGINRAPFDGEGVSAQRTVLVEDGRLAGYLHSVYTATRVQGQSTANGSRGGFKSTPEVSASNLYLNPGTTSLEGLLDTASEGFYVTEAMGVHTADPVSGDFSFGAAGLHIVNGRLGSPIRGVTIAGNVIDIFSKIAGIGDDLRFFGACGAPSLLISDVMVSGE
ncbi:MAG: peptide maturation [Candidatus Hydrogenedentota bacterium]